MNPVIPDNAPISVPPTELSSLLFTPYPDPVPGTRTTPYLSVLHTSG